MFVRPALRAGYEFGNAPHLGFPSSYDVHGDGSVVVVLAGGHTTGSVVVFVTLPAGKRYAFVGDLSWQLEGVRQLAERPLLMRKQGQCGNVRTACQRMLNF